LREKTVTEKGKIANGCAVCYSGSKRSKNRNGRKIKMGGMERENGVSRG